MIYLLTWWCKYNQEEKILAACRDKKVIIETAKSLNSVIGYVSGLGVYGQNANGYYSWREAKEIPAAEFEGNFQQFLEARN